MELLCGPGASNGGKENMLKESKCDETCDGKKTEKNKNKAGAKAKGQKLTLQKWRYTKRGGTFILSKGFHWAGFHFWQEKSVL